MSKPTYEELETAVANLEAALSTATESLANAHHVLRVETARSKELEAQVQEMAAESAIARKAVQTFCDVVQQNTDVICEEVGQDGVKAILAAMSATGNMAATDAALAEIRNDARDDIATQLEAKAAEYEESAKSSEFVADQRYRFAAAMFRGFAQQLRKEQGND
ncbi:ead/Ea22-like family protein [Cedecea neteri]|uniref:ead/Ea22-like family protein n=1 Tax=Cedecea neteri TaxID=158822 RepID=UPI0028933D90|nr:ead/Ea22-like family protein [Cedecea neteri]WNJ80581.1 ead/Ea22-like family protein [Cedecea neteri]